jgi:excisionase family DNA binding protein
MQTENLVLSQLSFNDLVAAISNDVMVKIKPLFIANQPAPPPPPKTETFLSRKEVAKLLKVSLPTLNEYTKEQKVKGYRIGARVLYKQSEVESSLLRIKGGNCYE